jgi:hypothetical protein
VQVLRAQAAKQSSNRLHVIASASREAAQRPN